MLNNIKTIIFDMDGTLIDSMHIWIDIDKEFFKNHGYTYTKEFSEAIEGLSMEETARYTIDTYNLPYSIKELIDIWNKMAEKKYRDEIGYKKGAYEFLKKIKNKGYKVGIATSNTRELVECVDKRLKFSEYVDEIITSNEVPHGKPAPDIYLKIADKLDSKPSECIVFEDIPNGIISAKNAGMQTCAIYDDFSKHLDNKKKELASYYITDYQNIINCV